jgi:8-oxo-dGTP pyrophosphatase MutT (NUDIX family)
MARSRKVLFNNKWLSVVLLDGWFVASEPSASKYNLAVAILPYRLRKTGVEFLARIERNPAHTVLKQHQISIITGACETGNPLRHAQIELLEEGGYDIETDRLLHCGIVNPLKTSCQRLCLYSVRILSRDKQVTPAGDGSEHEQHDYAEWHSYQDMVWAKDPYIQTIILRLKELGRI